ncbi:DUF2238 domain-containing protein [Tropicimonas marinistellae]|uniref:DUF2238 domain-containing protein n=1 Tax=Tropicimonas marinistellae TaxID=1739787 RepID=UPI00098F069F|nr:DUF2238 domain-containing protein [Tropicimonas marinistellae]
MNYRPKRNEIIVGTFTVAYVFAFTIWFLSTGNYEFIVYVATMFALLLVVGLSLRKAEYPTLMLWALSIWGLAHMAGGGVTVSGSVLYNLHLVPIVDNERMFILKYDQLVHAFGFGVTAWLLHHLLTRNFPATRGTATALIYPALASMGLGAVNEIIEFSAVLMVPDTNVGGYMNTALDLCFNALGAAVAMMIIAFTPPRTPSARSPSPPRRRQSKL